MKTLNKSHITTRIQSFITENTFSSSLQQAISYSIGGKFFRSQLVYALGQDLKLNQNNLDSIAIAIELLHTSTLIHDDLPCMDNDNYRRKKPSCHRQFNEATAVLSGDTLQALSFLALSQAPNLNAGMIQVLANSFKKLCFGQSLDLMHAARSVTEHLNIIELKTSALMIACFRLPSMLKLSQNDSISLSRAGHHLGLAFQLQDDLKDSKDDPNSITHILSIDEINSMISKEFTACYQLIDQYLPESKKTIELIQKIQTRS